MQTKKQMHDGVKQKQCVVCQQKADPENRIIL